MWIKKHDSNERRLRKYDRHMLRSAFVSLFWGAITERRKRGKFTLQELANRVGTNKSVVSRWFSKPHPNWRIDTIADIAGALDLEIRIEAVDRATGAVIAPSGLRVSATIQASDVAERVMVTTGSDPLTWRWIEKNGQVVPLRKDDFPAADAA